jgi:hypothetical protein
MARAIAASATSRGQSVCSTAKEAVGAEVSTVLATKPDETPMFDSGRPLPCRAGLGHDLLASADFCADGRRLSFSLNQR